MNDENKAVEVEFYDDEKKEQLNALRRTASNMDGLIAFLQQEAALAYDEYHNAAALSLNVIDEQAKQRARGRLKTSIHSLEIIERFYSKSGKLVPIYPDR